MGTTWVERDEQGRITAMCDVNGSRVKEILRDDDGRPVAVVDLQQPQPTVSPLELAEALGSDEDRLTEEVVGVASELAADRAERFQPAPVNPAPPKQQWVLEGSRGAN